MKVDLIERDFFKNPFTRNEMEDLLQERASSEMFNFRSPTFRALGLDKDKLSNEELIELMLKEPRLIRRPIVRIDGKVFFSANKSILEKLVS